MPENLTGIVPRHFFYSLPPSTALRLFFAQTLEMKGSFEMGLKLLKMVIKIIYISKVSKFGFLRRGWTAVQIK